MPPSSKTAQVIIVCGTNDVVNYDAYRMYNKNPKQHVENVTNSLKHLVQSISQMYANSNIALVAVSEQFTVNNYKFNRRTSGQCIYYNRYWVHNNSSISLTICFSISREVNLKMKRVMDGYAGNGFIQYNASTILRDGLHLDRSGSRSLVNELKKFINESTNLSQKKVCLIFLSFFNIILYYIIYYYYSTKTWQSKTTIIKRKCIHNLQEQKARSQSVQTVNRLSLNITHTKSVN